MCNQQLGFLYRNILFTLTCSKIGNFSSRCLIISALKYFLNAVSEAHKQAVYVDELRIFVNKNLAS